MYGGSLSSTIKSYNLPKGPNTNYSDANIEGLPRQLGYCLTENVAGTLFLCVDSLFKMNGLLKKAQLQVHKKKNALRPPKV